MLELRRQAEVMPVLAEQLDAQAVDGAEEGAIESGEHLERHAGFEDALPRPLLHLRGGAIRVGDDDQRGQPIAGVLVLREGHDAVGDGAGLAAAGGGHDGEVAIQLVDEAVALRLIVRLVHDSSSTGAKSGCVSAHFSARMSSSMASVASG